MTLRQLRIYSMEADGPRGVEWMYKMNEVNPDMKKDPKAKFINPAINAAVENLLKGKRWDA